MHRASESWYIYYKVAPERAEPAFARAHAIVAAACALGGVRGRVMRRCEEPAGEPGKAVEVTVMEAYDAIDDPQRFAAALSAAVGAAGLPEAERLRRRVERFRDAS
jgi:hypothetical protein